MKTLLRLPVLVIGIVLFTFACKENEEAVKPTQKSEIDFLEFDSRDAFDEAIKTNSINSSNKRFVSLKEAKSKSNLRTNADPLQIDNDFLQTVLNADGLIQIGDWIFKLDGSTRTVKALNKLNINFLPQLKKGTVVENKIFTFTFEDDVLDLLENGITSSPQTNQRIQLFCREKGVSTTHVDAQGMDVHNHYTTPASISRAIAWVNYKKWGIYFELRRHMLVNYFEWAVPTETHLQYRIKPKCKNEINYANVNKTNQYPHLESYQNTNGPGQNHKIYASTRALAKYWLQVTHTYSLPTTGNVSLRLVANHGY